MNRRTILTSILLAVVPGIAALVFVRPAAAGDLAKPVPGASAPANPRTVGGPRMVLPQTKQEVMGIQGGEIAHYSFEVRNEGTKDLIISDVRPGCGCTVATFDKVIAPGKTGTIKASVQTEPYWSGFGKEMTVLSNDPAQPSVMLSLIGWANPAYTVAPSVALAAPYEDTRPVTMVFTVVARRTDLDLKLPPATSGPVKVQVEPASANSWRVTMTLTPPESLGNVNGEADFQTTVPGMAPIKLTMVGLGEKGVTVSPAAITLGEITGSPQGLRQLVSLYSQKSVFHVTRVVSDDPALSVTITPVSLPTKISWYNLEAAYVGGWKRGLHHGVVTAYTDLPAVPKVKIPYSAEVR